jgi:hypothetical protein
MAAGVKPSALVTRQHTGALTPHAVFVKSLKKPATAQSSAMSQKWQKHGALAAKIKPASIRHAEKQTPAPKRWTPAKHSAWKPKAQSTATQSKTAIGLKKPSPAIAKAQDTH